MSKRKKSQPEITKHEIPGGGALYKKEYGKFDLSTQIRFESKTQKEDFYKTLDDCVSQTKSTDGINKFVNPDGKILKKGEKIEVFFDIEYSGSEIYTLRDVPSIHTEQDFVEIATTHSKWIGEPERPGLEDALKKVSASLFKLNAQHLHLKIYGKMMFLLAVLCSYSSHSGLLRDLATARRNMLLAKINTVEDLFKYGLVTGSTWSSAPFWNQVKFKLTIEYDSIPENNLLAPFSQLFMLFKDIIGEVESVEKSMYNSILEVLDAFKVFEKFYGAGSDLDKDVRRRKITDRFINLPKHISDPGFEIYNYQQKL